MQMKLGTDIVHIPRIEKALKENQQYFSQNVFCPEEWTGSSAEKLAGMFAAKEAVFKALSMKAGRWQEICIRHSKDGKPFLAHFPEQEAWKSELSISHDGEYAIAVVAFYQ